MGAARRSNSILNESSRSSTTHVNTPPSNDDNATKHQRQRFRLRRRRTRKSNATYFSLAGFSRVTNNRVVFLSFVVFVSFAVTILVSFIVSSSVPSWNEQASPSRKTRNSVQKQLIDIPSYKDKEFRKFTHGAPSCQDSLGDSDVDFTLVTQMSHSRLWMMEHHCRRWGKGRPISLAVLTNATFDETWMTLTEHLGCDHEQLLLEVVDSGLYDPTEYPVNLLRNMALARVRTSHVMYADVDFWPSTSLYDLLNGETLKKELAKDYKLALVVPAFQLQRQCREWRECPEKNLPMMPHDIDEVKQRVQEGRFAVFDPTNPGGHGSTLYREWFSQPPGTLLDIPCIKSNRYEPYLAFRYCHDLPPFQEGFTGYGKNKMTFVMQLRRVGYDFTQLGGAFVVHYPHLDSKSRMNWNESPDAIVVTDEKGNKLKKRPQDVHDVDWTEFKRGRVDALFVRFRNWLHEEVEDQSRVKMCKDIGKEGNRDDDRSLWIERD